MVCSACGFENQVGHRFCGMCGMPLPHRPLTAPGAGSTLNLTRVPFEKGRESQHSASGRTGVLTETPGSGDSPIPPNSAAAGQTAVDAGARAEEVPAEEPATVSGSKTARKELVPDLPLDEYIKTFHYEPPSDPSEITMRGDARVQDVEAAASETAETASPAGEAAKPLIVASDGARPSIRTDIPPAKISKLEPKPVVENTKVAEDVDSRLGLQPEAAEEARIERPRFLDINPPPGDAKPAATSGTSTIVGPSFLGLSDPPEYVEPSILETEEAEPASGRWRLWLAAAVILLFAGLGAMEWRSQRSQGGNGPVEVIKAKIRDLRHQNAPEAGTDDKGAAGANDSNAKPEMQVQEQPQPSPQNQMTPASGTKSGTAAAALTASTTTPTGNPVPAGAKTPAKETAAAQDKLAGSAANAAANQATPKPAPPQPAPQTAAEKPKPAAAASDNQDATGNQATPGAEEMAKARNASDSAAAAAWLWKATAKGNPDAPVQLADLYVKGDGVPRSCEQAVVLLKTAAEKENARARSRLAAMYATGSCVTRSRVEAYRWVSSALAANPSSQWAQQNRDLLWQQMTPEERAAAAKYR